jgi:prepilin-type N-terminal cleavage/methylation domain-containing protein
MPYKKYKFSAGFTIAELLITLAIMALLLAAVATAFNASAINFKENEGIFKTINNARQALFRITTDIRTGRAFKLDDPANKCTFFTANNVDTTYEYRNADGKLYLITNSDHCEFVLCDGVTAMNFVKTPTADSTYLKSVQITITVESNNTQQTLSAAAVVRKVLER